MALACQRGLSKSDFPISPCVTPQPAQSGRRRTLLSNLKTSMSFTILPTVSNRHLTSLCVAAAIAPTVLAAEPPPSLKPLYVRANSLTEPWSPRETIVGATTGPFADAADLAGALPGAAAVRNGALTGIMQLRGLSGDRVGIRVNGMSITPACPNHMDPPLHYADAGDGDRLAVSAGISPVSEGGDHIGGMVTLRRADPEFSNAPEVSGRLGTSFLGNRNAFLLNGAIGYSTSDLAINYRGTAATADDLRFPGGTVSDSGYDLMRHDLTTAWRTSSGFVEVDAGASFTRDAGTPALPMDMIEDDSWHFGLRTRHEIGRAMIDNRVYLHSVDHLMDNHSQRPLPVGSMAMDAPATSGDFGFDSKIAITDGPNTWRAGVDFHRAEFDATQIAAATGMVRDTFRDNRRTTTGVHLDWERRWQDEWSSRIGVRGDWVASDAGAVSNAILPAPGPMRNAILADQAAFNSADRSFDDLMVDMVASIRRTAGEHTAFELAAAFKNRAPSLTERYLWTPLNASAGLADGRTYMGNLALDPESAFEIAFTCEHRTGRFDFSLTPFYQWVSGYIQGMPMARLDSAGLPVLQYRNTDRADLYGAELAARLRLTDEWTLGTTASFVHGENQETGDSLYRIAPLRGMVELAWTHGVWESRFETVWAARQDEVSRMQGETETPGYGIFNLRVARTFGEHMRIEAGVENILDHRYADHLGGVNRVGGSDVAVGARIPSAGRFGYAMVAWRF